MKYCPNISSIIILSMLLVCFSACKKYLDKKSLLTQFVPTTIEDLQALLDQNGEVNSNDPALLEISADDFFVTSTNWEALLLDFPDNTLNYIWDKNAPPHNISWNNVYKGPVYYSNIVLDFINTIEVESEDILQLDYIKGAALFHRALAFLNLAQLYCEPYDSKVKNNPGIVLRMTSDINEKSKRATIQETYDRIIIDLISATQLLPENEIFPTRPTKAAAYGALARCYLYMRNYEEARNYSKLCLDSKRELLDYNNLLPLNIPPIFTFNREVIFHASVRNAPILGQEYAKVDTALYSSYSDKDLRKEIFFASSTTELGTYYFQGSYNGNDDPGGIFTGITTDEMYLIYAECCARLNDLEASLKYLNDLLRLRWENDGSWTPITASNSNEALTKILNERRKELIFRGIRWSDLRRYNLEGANITLKRIINENTYTLPPGDKRWVMLIPFEVINRSEIIQNER